MACVVMWEAADSFSSPNMPSTVLASIVPHFVAFLVVYDSGKAPGVPFSPLVMDTISVVYRLPVFRFISVAVSISLIPWPSAPKESCFHPGR